MKSNSPTVRETLANRRFASVAQVAQVSPGRKKREMSSRDTDARNPFKGACVRRCLSLSTLAKCVSASETQTSKETPRATGHLKTEKGAINNG
jgi:hypothetical protein